MQIIITSSAKSNMVLENNRSCETQLLETINYIAMAFKQTDLLLLDFSKAFDKVSHQQLLYKLSHCCINDPLFN